MRARLPIALGATLALGLGLTAAADAGPVPEKGRAVSATVEKVEYRGWKNNLKVGNAEAELVVTLDVGPRVISYRLAGGKNVFKNYDAMMGGTGEPEWKIRGGHRLWTAPEDTTRTYAPDNASVAYKELGPGSVRVTPPADAAHGVQKEIDLTLEPSGSKVTLRHRVTNTGKAPADLAVWSLSVMAPGGTEFIAMPPRKPHPGDVKNAKSAADFAPALTMVAWPFTDFQDPRWRLGSKFITLTQDASRGATKLGLAHRTGGVGYLNDGTLFVKRFAYHDGKPYPDGGVNFETFTNEDMLEMESLGPMVTLKPGETAEHVETWELFGGVGPAKTEAEIEANVAPKLR